MSRLKLYYPAEEITTDLYTYGSQLMTEDEVEYIGPYHQYITGEVYTGSTWNVKTSKKLIQFKEKTPTTIYNTLKPDIQLKYSAPIQATLTITQSDISNGSIQRYFIYKQSDNIIFEIDARQFSAWQSNQIDNKVYKAVQLTWSITGAKQDTKQGNVSDPGVITKNIQQINVASKTIPQITNILSNPLEFYVDTDFVKPIDINGLK